MKPTDLMIGDCVCIKGHPCKVSYLAPFDMGDARLAVISNDYDGNPYIDDIEPIPLTEEILKANEFRESIEEGVYYFPERYQEVNNRGFAVETEGDGKWFITDHELIVFSHVHKFQHVLRDCEMTDLADNFKV